MATPFHERVKQPRYYDMPFIYGYDGQDLTDGNSYDRLMIPTIPDSLFLLRRVTSTPTIVNPASVASTGRVQLYTQGGSRYFSKAQLLQGNYPVVPEVQYDPGAQIRFDLTNVLRANNSNGGQTYYYSQLCFVGVRRFLDTTPIDTPYRYYEKPQVYQRLFTIDYNGASEPVQYVQPINEFDFTLHAISISTTTSTTPSANGLYTGTWNSVVGGQFAMRLYDKNQQRLSNMPIDAAVYGWNCSDEANSTGAGVFPCPPLLYPVGSQIAFDVLSYLPTADLPLQVQVNFHGMWRLPCR